MSIIVKRLSNRLKYFQKQCFHNLHSRNISEFLLDNNKLELVLNTA